MLQTKKFGSKLQKIRKVKLIKKIGKKDYYHKSLQKINHQEFQLKSCTKAVCMERGRYANLSTFATNEKVRVETAKDKKSNIDKEDWKERLLSQKFTKNQSSRISVKKLYESGLHGTRPLCEFEHVCYKRKSSGRNCKG